MAERKVFTQIAMRKSRKMCIVVDHALYSLRNLVERCFNQLKDWRRIATRYDRCATTFLSAVALAATVIFWL